MTDMILNCAANDAHRRDLFGYLRADESGDCMAIMDLFTSRHSARPTQRAVGRAASLISQRRHASAASGSAFSTGGRCNHDRRPVREGPLGKRRRFGMSTVHANGIDVYYEVHGEGEPLVLIPYLAADQACYAFQVAEYEKHFTCFTVDLRGAGLTDKPTGTYTSELLADDVAAFLAAAGIEQAHVAGLSLGAATGMWLAAKYPERVRSLSLHSAWPRTDPFLQVVVEGWQTMAKALDSVTDMVIEGIFPWCFTPELYAARPDYIGQLADFVRSRPMPPVDAFLRQSDAVLHHDAADQLGRIQAPTLISFGQHDMVTSTRFAEALKQGILNSEIVVFDGCAHAPIYEHVEEFNARTLAFLQAHTG
jgi:3-oxoadipate enol-lactonase